MSVDTTELIALSDGEVVTHSFVRDVALPSGGVLALVTLDNDRDHRRPSTLGPLTMIELGQTLDLLRERAARGEIRAIAVTGKPYFLAAGADLSKVAQIPSRDVGKKMAQLGHEVLGKLHDAGVPTFVFINGLALGGGVEIALHADYRTIDASAPAVAFPEVFLGIIPGWGGAYLLPNLIGIENALKVIVENPLKNNRTLKAQEAFDLGIADAIFAPATFLEESIRWADRIVHGELTVSRPHQPGRLERAVKWDAAIAIARKTLRARIGDVAHAPFAALDLLAAAKKSSRDEGFRAEDEALADLVAGDQFRASIYAFDLVQKCAAHPAGAPSPDLARPITKVGIVGAGLMARQFALLFVRRLKVPVVITDLDQARVDQGVSEIRNSIDELLARHRVSSDDANRLKALVSGTTEIGDFADADWVIEAVFEELEVKKGVLANVERVVADTAVLATNTSSLSVTELGSVLRRPERLLGFHFFNPVAVMPLIEVVKTASTDTESLSTAMVVAKQLGKKAVITADAPGFVVNRVLAKLLGEAMHAAETGTPLDVVDRSTAPFGLPMTPFELLELVGLTVGAHVLDTHHAAFPDRFFDSSALHRLAEHGRIFDRDGKGRRSGFDAKAVELVRGSGTALTEGELQRRIEDGLADEIGRMLDEGVVSAPEDIDLCLILGAGWPFQMGGVTPYLDRVGATERVRGRAFHEPPIRGVG